MRIYIIKRFLMMLGTIFIIASLTFLLMHLIPGSPFDQDRSFNPVVEQNLRAFYKLDQPLYAQYFNYMGSLLTLDFGPSSISNTISTRFWLSCTICGSTVAAKRP